MDTTTAHRMFEEDDPYYEREPRELVFWYVV